jgi:hypothetical protein
MIGGRRHHGSGWKIGVRGGNYRWDNSFGNKFRQVNLRGSEADVFIFEGEGDDP